MGESAHLEGAVGSGMEAQGFIAIPVSLLQTDTVTQFDLYIRGKDDNSVLYRKANLPFSEEAWARLGERNIGLLWIPSSQNQAYRMYVEEHLGSILADSSIALEERSQLLYQSAQDLVKDVLEDPRSGDIIARSGAMVEHMVQFMYRDSRAFHQLMRVTSFDYYTYTHSVNVFVFATAFAQALGYDEAAVEEFGQGALLHDIGKSQIDDSILNCAGKLSAEQWQIMKQHPVYGHQLLEEQGVESDVVYDVVRHHHCKLNGGGYPDALRADEISQWARILTICDVFDALTTRRSYKDAMPSFDALRLMKEKMSDELDQNHFFQFVKLMAKPGKSRN